MKPTMKCRNCGGVMFCKRENYKYDQSGLEGVTLENVPVYRCDACGQVLAGIERMASVHRELAHALARKPEKLGPKEVRFMRKFLGLSSADFAAEMGVDPASVSRWESLDDPKPMGPQSERLLRLMVLIEKPVEEYHLRDMATRDARPTRIRLSGGENGWRVETT